MKHCVFKKCENVSFIVSKHLSHKHFCRNWALSGQNRLGYNKDIKNTEI
jgi:hypothetical protein